MVGTCIALPWEIVEADMIVAFKRLLDKNISMVGMDHGPAEGMNLTWHRVRHGHGWLKGMFLACFMF